MPIKSSPPAAQGRPPLVSVVLPMRNGERHLAPAIRSILGQSLGDLELIVVDDGSTDSSAAVVSAAAAGDPRLRIVPGPGKGIAHATNAGLAQCRGTYIARMDQDDLCRPHRFRRQVAFFEAHPGVGVLGGQKRLFGMRGLRQYRYPTSQRDIQAAVLFYCPLLGPTMLFRASLLPPDRMLYDPHEDYAEDYGLLTRWLLAGVGVAILPDVVLDYRVHAAQASTRHASRQNEVADGIRLRWLAQAGVAASPDELRLHFGAGQGQWGHGVEYLLALERWFLKLRAACHRAGFLDAGSVDSVLAQRWTSAVWANRGLGLPLFRLAMGSPLGALPHPEPWKSWAARLGGFLPARADAFRN